MIHERLLRWKALPLPVKAGTVIALPIVIPIILLLGVIGIVWVGIISGMELVFDEDCF